MPSVRLWNGSLSPGTGIGNANARLAGTRILQEEHFVEKGRSDCAAGVVDSADLGREFPDKSASLCVAEPHDGAPEFCSCDIRYRDTSQTDSFPETGWNPSRASSLAAAGNCVSRLRNSVAQEICNCVGWAVK